MNMAQQISDLQRLTVKELRAKYGDEQVHVWRRSYDVPPPALAVDGKVRSTGKVLSPEAIKELLRS